MMLSFLFHSKRSSIFDLFLDTDSEPCSSILGREYILYVMISILNLNFIIISILLFFELKLAHPCN